MWVAAFRDLGRVDQVLALDLWDQIWDRLGIPLTYTVDALGLEIDFFLMLASSLHMIAGCDSRHCA